VRSKIARISAIPTRPPWSASLKNIETGVSGLPNKDDAQSPRAQVSEFYGDFADSHGVPHSPRAWDHIALEGTRKDKTPARGDTLVYVYYVYDLFYTIYVIMEGEDGVDTKSQRDVTDNVSYYTHNLSTEKEFSSGLLDPICAA
jgi:hypothetical protein